MRHLLGHTSGLPGLDPAGHASRTCSTSSSRTAGSPTTRPGTSRARRRRTRSSTTATCSTGSSARATGRPLAEVFRDDVAGPLGAEFHLGVPDEPPRRRAPTCCRRRRSSRRLQRSCHPTTSCSAPSPTRCSPCRSATARPTAAAAVGSTGGHGTARGVARAQAVVSHGGELDGVRLLSPETVDRIFEVQADGHRPGAVLPLTFGIGYALPTPSAPAVPARPHLLVDGLRRRDRRQRPRPPHDRRLRAQPAGRPHGRLAPHRRLRAHRPRLPGGPVSSTATHVCIIGAGCSGITTAKRLKDSRHRLRPVRAERRRRRQLVLQEPQRPLGRLRVAAHRHLDAAAAVRGLPGPCRLPRLPAPHADPRLLPRVRRPLRPARRDRVRHRRRARRPGRRPTAAGTSRSRPGRRATTPTSSSPTVTTGARGRRTGPASSPAS